jgi:hypothetical protein
MALDAGVDPEIVSDRIGHANMAYTLALYTNPDGMTSTPRYEARPSAGSAKS